ncbi:MAG: sulfhydrogenase subunit alpha [Thermoleophilaceae bacterium]|jgi:coenzyme F420-reducing hydrogenase alpha subunit|nr:sulfhydrogenase subunit alpha [Thermoleophilaceae bacterium]MEA2469093.1 sulfhydrogenase subunit alpha [Thermoleophilaceae bacterium]
MASERNIVTKLLARVEGEGAMNVRIRDGGVADVQLRIYEPPRFFEAFLRGRKFTEVPDITARICGICPVAYQMSSIAAMEHACGVVVPEPVRALRRLLYCGEWVESHGLHVFMLHAPDFLGYASGFEMARDHPDLVNSALRLKKAGNELMRVVGGREIHPINVRVGGFYRAPSRRELAPVVEQLERAREFAVEAVVWTASLPCPEFEEEFEFVALRDEALYPIEGGRIASSGGLDIAPAAYEEHFEEEHVSHSTALHSRVGGRRYLTGPLARYALNRDRLSPLASQAADEAGLGAVVRNPFRSIVVRAVEILYALDEALRILGSYEPPDPPAVEVVPRAGVGCGATEAPRGLLWHRYEIDAEGTVLDAKIVPPTSQNQGRIEETLHGFVEQHVDLPDDELHLRCEQAIRSFDPCISCATHFLKLEVDRG